MREGRGGSERRKLLPRNECEGEWVVDAAPLSPILCEGGGGERKNPSLVFVARKGGWSAVTQPSVSHCVREGRNGGERRKPLPCDKCKGGWVVGGVFRVREGSGGERRKPLPSICCE